MSTYSDAVPLKAANKTTANQTDQVIDLTLKNTYFNHIILDCTNCSTETQFSIGSPVSTATDIIYLSSGKIFDEYVHGSKLYYSCATGTNTFNYVLL